MTPGDVYGNPRRNHQPPKRWQTVVRQERAAAVGLRRRGPGSVRSRPGSRLMSTARRHHPTERTTVPTRSSRCVRSGVPSGLHDREAVSVRHLRRRQALHARRGKGGTGQGRSRFPAASRPASWHATEHWSAVVDQRGWGVGIFHPSGFHFVGRITKPIGVGGPLDNPTAYLAVVQRS